MDTFQNIGLFLCLIDEPFRLIYLDENRQPTSAFYDLLNEYEKRFDHAKKHTSLPDVPDQKRISEFKSISFHSTCQSSPAADNVSNIHP